jgi:hypothetical protein
MSLAMMRALAVAHVIVAAAVMLLSALTIFAFPLFVIGPIWAIMLAKRMWRGDAAVIQPLRRTHYVFLAIDAVMIAYGFAALKAAEESAKRGGGLLGGFGIIPIAIGSVLAVFSIIVLICAVAMSRRMTSA